MKKTCLVLVAMLLSVIVVSAQENDSRSKKEIRKETQKMDQAVLAQEALNAINERRFVLEVDKISFKSGVSVFSNVLTNFIVLDGDKAIVQISSNRQALGPNGVGGITVEGTVSNFKISTDKRGNMNISMSVQGSSISAQVSINVPKDSNRAIGVVVPNFNPYRITLKGTICPLDQSNVFKGRSL